MKNQTESRSERLLSNFYLNGQLRILSKDSKVVTTLDCCLLLNGRDEILLKDETSVSTDVAKPIHVSREGRVRRSVTPPL